MNAKVADRSLHAEPLARTRTDTHSLDGVLAYRQSPLELAAASTGRATSARRCRCQVPASPAASPPLELLKRPRLLPARGKAGRILQGRLVVALARLVNRKRAALGIARFLHPLGDGLNLVG